MTTEEIHQKWLNSNDGLKDLIRTAYNQALEDVKEHLPSRDYIRNTFVVQWGVKGTYSYEASQDVRNSFKNSINKLKK